MCIRDSGMIARAYLVCCGRLNRVFDSATSAALSSTWKPLIHVDQCACPILSRENVSAARCPDMTVQSLYIRLIFADHKLTAVRHRNAMNFMQSTPRRYIIDLASF